MRSGQSRFSSGSHVLSSLQPKTTAPVYTQGPHTKPRTPGRAEKQREAAGRWRPRPTEQGRDARGQGRYFPSQERKGSSFYPAACFTLRWRGGSPTRLRSQHPNQSSGHLALPFCYCMYNSDCSWPGSSILQTRRPGEMEPAARRAPGADSTAAHSSTAQRPPRSHLLGEAFPLQQVFHLALHHPPVQDLLHHIFLLLFL